MLILVQKSNLNQTIKLKGGRTLGFAEVGDPEGKPLFHFHGYPGSRLEITLIEELLKNKSIRLIGIDRPGMGLSDFKENRKLLDWPDDVVELANHLGYDKFAIEGISGGGPYALACAYKIPDRLTTCGIIAGLEPVELGLEGMNRSNRMLFFFIKRMPFLVKIIMKRQVKKATNIDDFKKMLKKGIKDLPEPDKKIIEDPKRLDLFAIEMAEAFKQGSKGLVLEAKLYAKNWGFQLDQIDPNLKVYIWHGELDDSVPINMSREASKLIPNCETKFYPNEGHYSIAFNHMNEIFESLIK